VLEEVAHAAEIALAFFAYIGCEQDGNRRRDVGVAKGGGDAEQGSEAGGVVTDAGGIYAGTIFCFEGIARSACGKDGVEVGREEDTASVHGRGLLRCQFGEGIAFFVEVDVGEAQLIEALDEPGGSGGFSEGWSGDSDHLQLPLTELGLMEMQPVECPVNGGESGEAGDALVNCGGH
jgi:hypothetical protein